MAQAPEGGWMTTHTDAPADDLGNCPECGLPARECTALTMARLSAAEYLEDNAGLSRHAAKARALELIPERAKPRTADDLVERLTDDADWLRGFPSRSIIDNKLSGVDGRGLDATEALLREAAARIRSLEAQRDQAVGALARQSENMAFVLNRVDLHGWHNKLSRELSEDRAFLDSLTEKR